MRHQAPRSPKAVMDIKIAYHNALLGLYGSCYPSFAYLRRVVHAVDHDPGPAWRRLDVRGYGTRAVGLPGPAAGHTIDAVDGEQNEPNGYIRQDIMAVGVRVSKKDFRHVASQ
ncbi:hypothetical protein GB937_010808 [Aspergillus fischeri]|nr:hypothetical protein GB937_010808 [Aspergillus fischeri]